MYKAPPLENSLEFLVPIIPPPAANADVAARVGTISIKSPFHVALPSRGETNIRSRYIPVVFWIMVALLTIFGVFILPLRFPTATFLRSSSYTVGFNNRVAALVTVFISLAVTVAIYFCRSNVTAHVPADREQGPLPLRWFGIASTSACLLVGILGWFVVRANVQFADIGYWQNQIAHWSHGGMLYRDVEFCYGPILFYWPVSFEKVLGYVGIGRDASFIVALAAMQVLGLAILLYLLQQMPLSRTSKGIALIACTFGTLTPLLGLNYTWVRFLAAHAALMWISKKPNLATQVLLFGLAEIVMLSISPEVGFAFAAGTIGFALYRGWTAGRFWWVLIPVPLVAFGLFACVVNKGYFSMLAITSKGFFADVVQPFPYVEIFLLMAVALCPLAVARYVGRCSPDASSLVGMYVVCLAMVPAALGHCDGIHIFFNSAGLILISLIALEQVGRRSAKLGMGLLLILPIWSQGWLTALNLLSLENIIRNNSRPQDFNLSELEKIVGRDKIYLPIMAPQFVNRGLLASGQLEPSYFSYATNAETVPGMQRKVGEMNRARYVLIPTGSTEWMLSEVEDNWRSRAFRLGYKYNRYRPVFNPAAIFKADLHDHYDPVTTFGTESHEIYMLYRHK